MKKAISSDEDDDNDDAVPVSRPARSRRGAAAPSNKYVFSDSEEEEGEKECSKDWGPEGSDSDFE